MPKDQPYLLLEIFHNKYSYPLPDSSDVIWNPFLNIKHMAVPVSPSACFISSSPNKKLEEDKRRKKRESLLSLSDQFTFLMRPKAARSKLKRLLPPGWQSPPDDLGLKKKKEKKSHRSKAGWAGFVELHLLAAVVVIKLQTA